MGKAVIVTGASSGIGLGIALKYLSEGDDVVLVGRSLERLQSAIPKDFVAKGKVLYLAKDVSTLEGCRGVIEEGSKLLGGKLDALVNNAGAGKFGLFLADITPEEWANHMNLNVNSVLFLTQLATPLLQVYQLDVSAQASHGSIVNISSIAGQRPGRGAAAYSVSKAAVDMLTKASALELGPKGIRVNSINPSTVESNFFTSAGMTSDEAAAYLARSASIHPIGRIGAPADVAELCYFLTDGVKSGWLTGQCILLDGGRLLTIPVVQN